MTDERGAAGRGRVRAPRRLAERACTLGVALTLAFGAGCKSGDAGAGEAPPAAPTGTNMPVPGIGIEAEQGIVVYGVYDESKLTVNVNQIIVGDSLYATEPVPHTSVAGLDVTVDLGTEFRTLELVSGPWEATLAKQQEVLGWLSAFYKSIKEAAEAALETGPVGGLVFNGGDVMSMEGFGCARLTAVVERFQATTGLVLESTAKPQKGEGEFFVCLQEKAQDFWPQANYGVKLSAFVDGAIARDFQGRPERMVVIADGGIGSLGPGCALTEAVYDDLRASLSMSLAPIDMTAFCHPQERTDTAACGAPFVQPSVPCLPGCLMGQLCYGLATNQIWYEGSARTAESVLCEADAAECPAAALLGAAVTLPDTYASRAAASERDSWTDEERAAIRALLVFNGCAAWINSMSTEGVSPDCRRSFWKKQMMGALPKARFEQFRPHLPAGFDNAGGGGEDPPLTTLATYQEQTCENTLFLGETARANCKEYVSGEGLDGFIGGKSISVFRIDGELALVIESRFPALYVAGGYLGILEKDGSLTVSDHALRESVNFVRTINGFEAE